MNILLHCAETCPGVCGPGDGRQVGAKSRVAGRWQQAPPGVSVGTGAEGGVQALRAKAGGQGSPCRDPILPCLFQGVRSGASQAGWG